MEVRLVNPPELVYAFYHVASRFLHARAYSAVESHVATYSPNCLESLQKEKIGFILQEAFWNMVPSWAPYMKFALLD